MPTPTQHTQPTTATNTISAAHALATPAIANVPTASEVADTPLPYEPASPTDPSRPVVLGLLGTITAATLWGLLVTFATPAAALLETVARVLRAL